jgi:hypothetical protein
MVAMFCNIKLKANEAINNDPALAVRNGRKIALSIAKAMITGTQTVNVITRGTGNPETATNAYAPAVARSPYAKLTKRMTPNTSETPRAKSA